jgi:biopolymer transport protein ExbD
MKKRILLSLVSFFMMTAMWASLVDAYKIEVNAANGKTFGTAELKLTMKNRNAITFWGCILTLPEGVTFVDATTSGGRYPEGIGAEFTPTPLEGNKVQISCLLDGAAFTGTDGEVATVTVQIDGSVEPGEYVVTVTNVTMEEYRETGDGVNHTGKDFEFKWTIEQGEDPTPSIPGDVNGDKVVDIADAISVLNTMAAGEYSDAANVNGDEVVDIADFVSVLNIMASSTPAE